MEKNTGSSAELKIESKNKKNLIFFIVGVAIVLAIWYWQAQKGKIIVPLDNIPAASETNQQDSSAIGGDTTSVINQELDSIDISDLDKEFQTIDSDLNSL